MFMFLKKLFTKTPLGLIVRVENKNKHHAADKQYYVVKVKFTNGVRHLMLTDTEVERALKRVEKNKEDLPK